MKKKKKALIVLAVVLVLLLVGWWYLFLGNKIKDASTEITKGDADTKALIVYFTRSGAITAEGSSNASPGRICMRFGQSAITATLLLGQRQRHGSRRR